MSDEYDAFGRKRDEAGLGDLGWGSSGDPDAVANPETPTTAPTVSTAESGFSAPHEFKTVITSGDTPRTWRPRRNPFVWFIQLAILGGIGFGIYAAVDAGNDAVQGVRDTFESISDIGGPGAPDRGDTTVPPQVGARKLFTPDGLRSAIKVMETEVPGRVYTFAIRRERINASIIQGNKQVFVNFNADAEIPEIQSSSTATGGGDTFSYEEMNVQAPFRLLKVANQRVNRSEADVDYFSAQSFTGRLEWGIYYEGGSPIAIGDSRGRYVRRIS
jgi:hypothetical protein